MKPFYALTLIAVFCLMSFSKAQNPQPLPFEDISTYPDAYTSGTVAARMVESLGFRYRYATQGLEEENMDYRASEVARTIGETMDHIYGLSIVVHNSVIEEAYTKKDGLDLMEGREESLHLLKAVYDRLLIMDDKEVSAISVRDEHPFWILINGPLVDAIWHSGQIATLRRAAGNPMPKGVNVFLGKYSGKVEE
ncbi:hypothetical protein DN752_12235 [Echinicola strongylocentroti]|uniref:DinB family protein n=1 Tax=Echinicola strongylocentroti TaxID=1795355 RepID=A0A2Z4II78_9BACT|nr:hypothetical protein [Echinicola strongylocentroti]AWW30831.1 hypothetical protein DN752_12235 [Echinicola strongylocentroti]